MWRVDDDCWELYVWPGLRVWVSHHGTMRVVAGWESGERSLAAGTGFQMTVGGEEPGKKPGTGTSSCTARTTRGKKESRRGNLNFSVNQKTLKTVQDNYCLSVQLNCYCNTAFSLCLESVIMTFEPPGFIYLLSRKPLAPQLRSVRRVWDCDGWRCETLHPVLRTRGRLLPWTRTVTTVESVTMSQCQMSHNVTMLPGSDLGHMLLKTLSNFPYICWY